MLSVGIFIKLYFVKNYQKVFITTPLKGVWLWIIAFFKVSYLKYAPKLYEMSLSDHGEDKIKILLDDRNLKWMCKIEQLIHTQPAFIAVGAAHLDGENRLINLLRERGYTVSPFMADR